MASSRTSTGGTTGVNPSPTSVRGHPLHERELEQDRFAHEVREAGAAHLHGLLGLDPAHRLAERGVVERRRRGRVADDAHHRAVVLTTVGHRRVGGVGDLQRQRAHFGVDGCERLLERLQLLLQRTRGRDLRRTFVGCGASDVLRRRVLPRAQLLDRPQLLAPRRVGREHVVDQAGRDTLAFDADAVVGLLAQALEVDHTGLMRGRCAGSGRAGRRATRSASRSALVTALRRAWPSAPRHRVRAEELHLGLLRREVAETVGDELVVEVALEVDEEAVVAEVALGGPRLELGDVDRARRELLQDREQRTGTVLALEAHDRRLVVTGRRGHAVAHQHEAGLVLGVVLDLAGQDLEAGVGRTLAGADRRHRVRARVCATSPPGWPPRRWSSPRPRPRRGGASPSTCGSDRGDWGATRRS